MSNEIVGTLKSLKTTKTKTNRLDMAFGTLEHDRWTSTSFVVFPQAYSMTSNRMRLVNGKKVKLQGELKISNNKPQFVVSWVKDIDVNN